MAIDPVLLTQELVRCPSVTPIDAGAQAVMTAALEQMNFTVHRLIFGTETPNPVHNFFAHLSRQGSTVLNSAAHSSPLADSSINGEEGAAKIGPRLCFMGHTDVVPTGRLSDWTTPPFDAAIEGDRLIGRGSADMKGANAAFVAAVSRFLLRYPDWNGTISLAITGDEEGVAAHGTVKIVEWMRDHDHIPDAALVGEPSNPQFMGQIVRVGRRGSWCGKLIVEGKQGHSAYPELADNPAHKIVTLLHQLLQQKFDNGTEFFKPSDVVVTSIDIGNEATNVIPARAQALINIRFNDHWTGPSLEQHVRSIFDETKIPYELYGWCNAESFMTNDAMWRKLVADAVQEVSQIRPVFDTGGGTSDARFIAPYCPVVEYGLINATIHQINECVFLNDLETLTQTYFVILKKFFSVGD